MIHLRIMVFKRKPLRKHGKAMQTNHSLNDSLSCRVGKGQYASNVSTKIALSIQYLIYSAVYTFLVVFFSTFRALFFEESEVIDQFRTLSLPLIAFSFQKRFSHIRLDPRVSLGVLVLLQAF